MSLYRVTTVLFDTTNDIRLHSSDAIIDAISPAQAMRKHNLPRITGDQIITIQITKCMIKTAGLIYKGPPHEIDKIDNPPSNEERLKSSEELLDSIKNTKTNKKRGT